MSDRSPQAEDHGMSPCSGCGAQQDEPCLLRVAWDPIGKVCDRQAEQAASPQGEDHEAIERIVAAASDLQYPDAFVGRVVRQNLAALASAPSPERDTERLRESLQEWKDAWTAQGKIHAAETARLERDTERFMKALRELKAVLAEFPDTDTENG